MRSRGRRYSPGRHSSVRWGNGNFQRDSGRHGVCVRLKELEDAAHRGVEVRIVADFKASEDRYSQIPILSRSGAPIRLDRRYEIMHDKFMVIDGDAIETGSFNYSEASRQAQCREWDESE